MCWKKLFGGNDPVTNPPVTPPVVPPTPVPAPTPTPIPAPPPPAPAVPLIAIVNQSTVLTDAQLAPVVAALQKQVTGDWQPVWGSGATLVFVPKGQAAPAGSWQLVILDDSDQAGALGYHDITSDGQPLGKVFARTDIQNNLSWSVTISHELLEMLGDPDVNLTVFNQTGNTTGRLYAYEVCDAVEADGLGYQIDGVQVSDFVYPAWFESFRQPGSTQFDHGGHLNGPGLLAPGGYIGYFDVTAGSGWSQKTAEGNEDRTSPRIGSRRERRARGKHNWKASTV